MQLSVFTHPFLDQSLETTLDFLKKKGIEAVELGSGGYTAKGHCNPQELLENSEKFKVFMDAFESRGMKIACVSCHGNPLHPNQELAHQHHEDLIASIDLASKIGLKTVVTFSGCPGDHEAAIYPHWCVYPWPLENNDIIKYQWEEKILPYWERVGKYAAERGINLAFELQGGVSVYNPATLLRLRKETNQKSIGANVDPSHFWWQGIDPVEAIRIFAKEECLYFFHAKDANCDSHNMNYSGVVDSQSFAEVGTRAWIYRSVGYGHDAKVWADMLSILQAVGYDGYISIEHEDGLMSVNEGLTRSIEFLQRIMISEPAAIPLAFIKK